MTSNRSVRIRSYNAAVFEGNLTQILKVKTMCKAVYAYSNITLTKHRDSQQCCHCQYNKPSHHIVYS